MNGQAEVIAERCIACGNCVNVCSQGAKAFARSENQVNSLLAQNKEVIALVAPSFPAEFTELENPNQIVSMLKALGFARVVEVSFGADLVAMEYKKLQETTTGRGFISSDCPAVVACIERHHPALVPHLAPIASPMVAIARVVKAQYGADIKTVFIGPCLAKKGESEEIDEALTFTELRNMFVKHRIWNPGIEAMDFDPPHAAKGASFPVSHGLLSTMGKSVDLACNSVVVTDGKSNFISAIKEYEKGNLCGNHLELLCCEGCISGPGMSKNGNRFHRRNLISNYVQDKLKNLDKKAWDSQVATHKDIDFSQQFKAAEQHISIPTEEAIKEKLTAIGKYSSMDHLNCGACGYDSCREHAIAILNGLAENEMCLPDTIEKMHGMINDLNTSNEKLANARQALEHSEKLATMGQLSAGIAHELNNPLGVITMYSNILKEESKESEPFYKDLNLITEQANRCKEIVAGLLNFARQNQVKLEATNMTTFCKHSLQSVIKPENIQVSFQSSLDDHEAMIDQDQMMQVLTNLEKNAVEAMLDGGHLNINLEGDEAEVRIQITDTGSGIAKENLDKIFTPFFTTKAIGKGTGMGLPLVYGIIKMHKGQLKVESNTDPQKAQTGTTFTIVLPRGGSIENTEKKS